MKVDVKLATIKTLHGQWIIDFYNKMQLHSSKSMIHKGFKKAHIREAFDQAHALQECIDNPFWGLDIELA